jgi:hypothetical protein
MTRDFLKSYSSYAAALGLALAAAYCFYQGDFVHAQAYGAAALGLVGVHLHVSDKGDDPPPPAPPPAAPHARPKFPRLVG